jgi:hypothetical protein
MSAIMCRICHRVIPYCQCVTPTPLREPESVAVPVTPEQWAALATDRLPGVCQICHFDYSPDDCYIPSLDGGGICERCHHRIVSGDDTRLDPHVRRQVEGIVNA